MFIIGYNWGIFVVKLKYECISCMANVWACWLLKPKIKLKMARVKEAVVFLYIFLYCFLLFLQYLDQSFAWKLLQAMVCSLNLVIAFLFHKYLISSITLTVATASPTRDMPPFPQNNKVQTQATQVYLFFLKSLLEPRIKRIFNPFFSYTTGGKYIPLN